MKRKAEEDDEKMEIEESAETENNESISVVEVVEEIKTERKENSNLYKVLGNQEMKNLESLKVTSSWVSNATTFTAIIDESTTQEISTIDLPDHISANIPSPIKNWFPVQSSVLPTLLSEIRLPGALRPRDVAIAAPTGSGKTLCYILPVLAAVGMRRSDCLHAVILVPAQTLATQVKKEFEKWNANGNAKIVCLSGGNDFQKEARKIASELPNVIVATPARLVQHLTHRIPAGLDLKKLRYLIVDEADRMGKLMREEWLEIVEFLCGGMDRVSCLNDVIRQRRAPQKIVLSATLSKDVEELHLWNLFRPRLFSATARMSKDISKDINHISGTLALPSTISHKLIICEQRYHPLAVYKLICEKKFNRTLIFVNQVSSSNRLAHVLKELCEGKFEIDYFTAQLFGKRRHRMLQKFNNNSNRVMICSDVLARGTDLNKIDCVINYNLPADDKLFVHRAGRTGRAGQKGHLFSIGDKDTKRIFVKMLKATNLWGETVEEQMEENEFEKDRNRYAAAIESLKNAVGQEPRAKDRSGFEAKRRSRPNAKGEKPWLKRKEKNNTSG